MAKVDGIYMEITLENDQREMTLNPDEIRKFIPLNNCASSLVCPEKFKENPQSNNITLTMVDEVTEDTRSFMEFLQDKNPKHIRIYSFMKEENSDKKDEVLKVSDFGDALFIDGSFSLSASTGIKTEVINLSYTNIADKWIEKGVIKSSMNSDYKKYL